MSAFRDSRTARYILSADESTHPRTSPPPMASPAKPTMPPAPPHRLLENLRCTLCNALPTSPPLMVRPPDQQVCNRCFGYLPAVEQRACARQVALEALLGWGEGAPEGAGGPLGGELGCETGQLGAVFRYDVEESKYSNEVKSLRYSLRIRGVGGNALGIGNDGSGGVECKDWHDIELNLIGSVLLGPKPEVIYSNIKVETLKPESIYETIDRKSLPSTSCSQCKALLEDPAANYCLQGHASCANCKEKMCAQCVYNSENRSRSLCKNYHRGCITLLKFDELHQHQMDCMFNDFSCPLEQCSASGALPWIKQHLLMDHTDQIVSGNEISRKFTSRDHTVVLLCYDSVFKCVYYYYKTFVEIFVTQVGPSGKSARFSYEVSVSNAGCKLLRKGKCSGWNDVMLQKGVTIERRELGDHDRKLNLDVQIRILDR